MKLKKYGKGGKYDMYQKGGGVTVTKKMVDDEFKKTFESSANLTNDLARQLSKGVDSKGMPLKPAAKKALAEEVRKRKAKDQAMKPNYRYVGTKVPGGKSPSFKKGGKVKKKGMTTAERKNQYMDSIKDKQKKDQSEVSQKNKIRLMAGYGSNRFVPAPITEKMKYADKGVKNLAANREKNVYKPARESASKRFDKATKYDELLGRSTNPNKKYKEGGKMYLKGGQVKLDKNKDGKISGADFKMMKLKKK